MHAAMEGHSATVVQLATFVKTPKSDSLAGLMFAKSHAQRIARRYAHGPSDVLDDAAAQRVLSERAAAGHVTGTCIYLYTVL